MDPSVQQFLRRLDGLSGAGAEIAGGIRQAISIAESDPEMALTRLRKVLEFVLRDVFVRRCGEDPGTRPLENVLQRLVKDGHLPDRLGAYANTIRMLGNVGTHKFNQNVTRRDVDQSLLQLLPIVEWHLEPELRSEAASTELPSTEVRSTEYSLRSRPPGAAVSSGPVGTSAVSGVYDAPPRNVPTIGGFELLSILGEGAQSVVYRARQLVVEREVALKCLRSVGDRVAETRFLRQIKALGQVDHPHIERVHAWGVEGEHWYFATELLAGSSLACIWEKVARSAGPATTAVDWPSAVATACAETRRQEKPLTSPTVPSEPPPVERERPNPVSLAAGRRNTTKEYVRDVVEIIRQMATAAHKLHEAGIIHRDIKPANIMVSPDGKKAVLMDLGVARVSSVAVAEMTGFRHFVGTLPYSSPEQSFSADSADARSDVYSLGATLWELLTLRPLFGAQAGASERELIHRIQFVTPDPIRHYNKAVSHDLQAVVRKCLQKDPLQRYETAGALANELSLCLDGCRSRQTILRRPTTIVASACVAMLAFLAYHHFHKARPSRSEGPPDSSSKAETVVAGIQSLPESLATSFASIPDTPYAVQIVEVDDTTQVSVPIREWNDALTVRLRPGKLIAIHIYNRSKTIVDVEIRFVQANDERPMVFERTIEPWSVRSIPGVRLRTGPKNSAVGAIHVVFKPATKDAAGLPTPSLQSLREAVARLTVQVAEHLNADVEAGHKLNVEAFRGPNQPINAEVTLLMRQSLMSRGFHIVPAFAYTVRGRVRFDPVSSGTMGIVADVHDRLGEITHSYFEVLASKHEPHGMLGGGDASVTILYDVSELPILPIAELPALGARDSTKPADSANEGPESGLNRSAGRRCWAIVIGVQDYESRSVTLPRYPINEAQHVFDALLACEYPRQQVKLLHCNLGNATRAKAMSEIEELLERPGPEDLVFIYFSGHAFIHEQECILATSDYRKADPLNTGIRSSWLDTRLRVCRAAQRVLVLDCSRAGQQGAKGSEGQSLQRALKRLHAEPKGLVVISSCADQQQSFDWEEKSMSVFTFFLTEGLKGEADRIGNQDGIVDHLELSAYVQRQVSDTSPRVKNGGPQLPMLYRGQVQGPIPVTVPKSSRPE